MKLTRILNEELKQANAIEKKAREKNMILNREDVATMRNATNTYFRIHKGEVFTAQVFRKMALGNIYISPNIQFTEYLSKAEEISNWVKNLKSSSSAYGVRLKCKVSLMEVNVKKRKRGFLG